jgi:membrane-associated phospholipid phosphatase
MDWVIVLRSPLLTNFFQYITWLGYSDFLFLFIPFCYWFCDRKVYGVLPQFVFISALINSFAKSFFEDPRPDNALNIDPWLDTINPSFGFPSGHAQLAVVIWGFIFLKSNNISIKTIAMFLLVSISLSRIYLGVHDVTDVIGGLILGGISLIFLELILKGKIYFLNKAELKYQGILYLSLLMIFLIIWPNEDTSVLIGLGLLIIGFWLGQYIDQNYFEFSNSFNFLFKFTSSIIALIGFIAFDQMTEKFLTFFNTSHLIEIIISSFILGIYISFISLFILKYLKLQKTNN